MRKIENFDLQFHEGTATVNFEGNKNVKKIAVTSANEVEICYIQNSIIDTPLPLGKTREAEDGKQEIVLENAISASSICFSNDAVRDIEVYESEETNLLNLYPKCIDIPLKENYYLESISVFNSPKGYSEYSLFTSVNGRDFELAAIKNNSTPCDPKKGDIYSMNGKEARVIRVYYEYNSESPEVAFEKIEFKGEPSGSPIVKEPQINICSFEASEYNVPITDNDTINEVYGIIERRIGSRYKEWFYFKVGKKQEYNYFDIEYKNGKIEIIGNNGVSIASGLNYYLKYFCNVCISQVGDQVSMPKEPIAPKSKVHRETKAKIRYAYNYCTLSYTSSFWGEEEWQKELDWLALNGVNAVLDITAQEEVWRRFLSYAGYTHAEIKNFLTGPHFYAWFCMANTFSVGGPLHDSWFEERTRLARLNHLKMRKLGMNPILQGYSGMIPIDIQNHDEDIEIVRQGTWCAIQRPAMIKTNCQSYERYAEMFYKAQEEVLGGDAIYYAFDVFHEGGVTGGMSMRDISRIALSQLLKANSDAIWVIQSWQGNPTSELLAGLDEVDNGKEHALILDLYAEKTPHYCEGKTGSEFYGYSPEFDGTPWVYCMLNNFGGRLGLHGHLDNMARDIPKILGECRYFSGIGMTCEASENNPVLYDFLFELIWVENADKPVEKIDIAKWLHLYCERKYGKKSKAAEAAWDILADTVYKAEYNMLGQGAPESMVNARPEFNLDKASMWGNAIVGYDMHEFEKAAKLMLEDYEKLKYSDGYIYDIVSVFQQLLSNRARKCYEALSEAYNQKNIADFKKCSDKFLKIADDMARLTANCDYYRLERYMNNVKKLVDNRDDFSKRLYITDAKQQLTVMGPYVMSEESKEYDYANRQWSGLIANFYKPRWKRYLEETLRELEGKPYKKDMRWYEWEWSWVRNDNNYSDEDKLGEDFFGFLSELIKGN